MPEHTCAIGQNATMPGYIALLRGVNVGGSNKVAMAQLRGALEAAGFGNVRTYIQSGNIVLQAPRTKAEALSARIHSVILDVFGLDVPTVVVDAKTLTAIKASSPYSHEADPRRVHVFFLPAPLDAASRDRVAQIQSAVAAKGSRDAVTVDGAVMYLHTPDGFGVSELAKALSTRGPGGHRAGTARNWATVTTLLEMVRP